MDKRPQLEHSRILISPTVNNETGENMKKEITLITVAVVAAAFITGCSDKKDTPETAGVDAESSENWTPPTKSEAEATCSGEDHTGHAHAETEGHDKDDAEHSETEGHDKDDAEHSEPEHEGHDKDEAAEDHTGHDHAEGEEHKN